jgi:hypothetical protein
MITDSLEHYMFKSIENNHQSVQYERLFNDLLFGGNKVSLVTYRHVESLVRIARGLMLIGQCSNARMYLFHAARNMGLIA